MITGKIIAYTTSAGPTDRIVPGSPLKLFVDTESYQDSWSWNGWREKLYGSGNGKSPNETTMHLTVRGGMVATELDFGIMPNHDVDLTLRLDGETPSGPLTFIPIGSGIGGSWSTLDVVVAHIRVAGALPVVQPSPPYNPPSKTNPTPLPGPGTPADKKPSGIPSWLLPVGIVLIGAVLLLPLGKDKK